MQQMLIYIAAFSRSFTPGSYKTTLYRHVLVTICTKFNENPFNGSLLNEDKYFEASMANIRRKPLL
jgi:hypothetical protein